MRKTLLFLVCFLIIGVTIHALATAPPPALVQSQEFVGPTYQVPPGVQIRVLSGDLEPAAVDCNNWPNTPTVLPCKVKLEAVAYDDRGGVGQDFQWWYYTPTPHRIELSPASITLRVGESTQGTVEIYDFNNTRITDTTPYAWIPTEINTGVLPTCVEVSRSGLITAIQVGTCGVSVVAGTVPNVIIPSQPITVTVLPVPTPTPTPTPSPTPVPSPTPTATPTPTPNPTPCRKLLPNGKCKKN